MKQFLEEINSWVVSKHWILDERIDEWKKTLNHSSNIYRIEQNPYLDSFHWTISHLMSPIIWPFRKSIHSNSVPHTECTWMQCEFGIFLNPNNSIVRKQIVIKWEWFVINRKRDRGTKSDRQRVRKRVY